MVKTEEEIRKELNNFVPIKYKLTGTNRARVDGYIKGLRFCLGLSLADNGLEEQDDLQMLL